LKIGMPDGHGTKACSCLVMIHWGFEKFRL
jgi:hypothetical protein